MSTQDTGQYIPSVRQNGIRLNANEPLVVAGSATFSSGITTNGITNTGTTSGSLKNVVNLTSTAAPTAAQSGTLFTLSAAAGFVVTLPTPVVGLTYEFAILTTVTSNSYKIITSAGTVFMQGVITQGATTASLFAANGTSHVAITMTGGAVGGFVGSYFAVQCLSATLWEISGFNLSASTPTTPFTTS
jgi:hypothetical protein